MGTCNVGDESKQMQAPPPSFADIAAAMKVLQPTPPPEPSGLQKHISGIMVALILGLGAWLMTGLNSMQASMAQVVATVATIQKQVDAMAQRTESGSASMSELRTSVARIEQRVTQDEQRLNVLEGRGAPLYGNGQRTRTGSLDSGI